jgi:hypothetical protein
MNYFTLGAYVEIESGLLVQVGVTMNPPMAVPPHFA